jgi:hypothetical protein
LQTLPKATRVSDVPSDACYSENNEYQGNERRASSPLGHVQEADSNEYCKNMRRSSSPLEYVQHNDSDEYHRNKRRSSSPFGYVQHDDSDEYHRNKNQGRINEETEIYMVDLGTESDVTKI